MGTIRVPWEDQYGLSYRTTAIGASDAETSGLFEATNDGIAAINPSGECGLLIDEHPSISPGVEVNTVEKTTGLAQPQTGASAIGVELHIARKTPTFSIGAMGLTPEKAEVFLWSLFQKGATETAVTFEKNYVPYSQGESGPEMYLDISRSIGDPASVTGYGQCIFGAIVTSFGVSGSQGERFSCTAEIMGRTYRDDYIHTASVLTSEDTVDHVFLDYAWTIDGTAASLQSFDMTIINNAVAAHYNSLIPTNYTLHRMAVTGNFALAMSTTTIGDYVQVDNFVAGDDVLIVGTHSSSDIIWSTNARYTGAEVDPAEVELLLNLPYEGVYDGTNQSIEVDIDFTGQFERSIPA